MMLCIMVGFTACSDDDDTTNGTEEGLVSENIPTEKGWSGSLENGQSTYTPESYGEYPGYYAFSFKNGSCEDAVFNIVCDSEMEAQLICNMLNNGTFDDLGFADYDDYATKAAPASVLSQSLRLLDSFKKTITSNPMGTRADMLGISCSQNGKVVFFKLDCFKGKNGEIIKSVVETWTLGSIDALPEDPIFGTYDRNSGKYTNNNIMGIANTKYEISVKFNGDYLTEFVTTLTLPNPSWAMLMEETFQEQEEDYIEMFGEAPQISRNGNLVTVKAVIIGEVTREFVEQYIVMLDIMMNRPIALSLL